MGIINQDAINSLTDRQDLTFEEVMALLRANKKVRRAAWKDLRYIALQKPDENSKMKQAYLFCVPLDHQPVPFALSNNDLFAQDWQVFK